MSSSKGPGAGGTCCTPSQSPSMQQGGLLIGSVQILYFMDRVKFKIMPRIC
jgi:hypothetical protein